MKDDGEDILRDLLSDHDPKIKHRKRSFVITCGNFRVIIVHRNGKIELIRAMERDGKGGYRWADSNMNEIMEYRYWSWTRHNRSAWPNLRIVTELTEDLPHFTSEGTAKFNDDVDTVWYRDMIKKMLNLKDADEN